MLSLSLCEHWRAFSRRSLSWPRRPPLRWRRGRLTARAQSAPRRRPGARDGTSSCWRARETDGQVPHLAGCRSDHRAARRSPRRPVSTKATHPAPLTGHQVGPQLNTAMVEYLGTTDAPRPASTPLPPCVACEGAGYDTSLWPQRAAVKVAIRRDRRNRTAQRPRRLERLRTGSRGALELQREPGADHPQPGRRAAAGGLACRAQPPTS